VTIYRYPEPSVIDEIAIKKADSGSPRAHIHAREGTSAAELAGIYKALHSAHYTCVPVTDHGRPVLEVRGFMFEKQLTSFLEQQKAVSGEPTVVHDQKSKGIFQKIKDNSLFTSGLFYTIGDIKFITYGRKGESPLNMAAGVFYGLGTWANLFFNRKSNADLQVQDLSQRMADHMNAQNFDIPQSSSIHCITHAHKKGLIQKADDYFRHYPAEMMNSFFAMAGVCIAAAAYKATRHNTLPAGMLDEYMVNNFGKKALSAGELASERALAEPRLKKMHKAANWLDVGLGSMTFSSGMFGTLVKEKAKDPDAPEKHGMAKAWEYAQQHPLTITGVGLMVSTMCHAVSTGIEYRIGTTNGKKAIFDRGVFVAANLIAEFLVSISSKGHGEGVVADKTVDESAISIAADLIAKHPAKDHEHLVDYMSKFLGRKDVLAIKDDEVKDKLRSTLAHIQDNPWAHCTPGMLAPEAPAHKHDMSAQWQNVLASSTHVAPQAAR
jgi:hypothetical protein